MNTLPPELHDRIVRFVGRRIGEESRPPWEQHELPVVAAVSRNFQHAVERLTFRRLTVSTSPDDLDALRRILIPRRQCYLQELVVHLWFDHAPQRCTITPPRPRPFATDDERRAIDEATTAHLKDFCNFLASWCVPDSSLVLEVRGPPLSRQMEDISGSPYLRFSLLGASGDLAHLPSLPMVKTLYISSESCHLHPRLAILLTAKMPNVSRVEWDLASCESTSLGLYHHMSRIWRDSLVQAIETSSLPASVEKFSFNMHVPGTSEFQVLPDFLGSSSIDPVSTALRELTKDCAEVRIEGSIHPSLFDLPTVSDRETTPTWQKLTNLTVRACMRGPDGKWLFKLDSDNLATPQPPPQDLDFGRLPPGYGATEQELDDNDDYYDEHHEDIAPSTMDGPTEDEFFRSEPEDAQMNALVTAFVRGCGRMPALQIGTLHCELVDVENWPFQVNCFAANTAAVADWDARLADGDRGALRVFFHVKNEWRPSAETLGEIRRVGRECNGRDTIVGYLPWGDYFY